MDERGWKMSKLWLPWKHLPWQPKCWLLWNSIRRGIGWKENCLHAFAISLGLRWSSTTYRGIRCALCRHHISGHKMCATTYRGIRCAATTCRSIRWAATTYRSIRCAATTSDLMPQNGVQHTLGHKVLCHKILCCRVQFFSWNCFKILGSLIWVKRTILPKKTPV